jgi:hypothetical protein
MRRVVAGALHLYHSCELLSSRDAVTLAAVVAAGSALNGRLPKELFLLPALGSSQWARKFPVLHCTSGAPGAEGLRHPPMVG